MILGMYDPILTPRHLKIGCRIDVSAYDTRAARVAELADAQDLGSFLSPMSGFE